MEETMKRKKKRKIRVTLFVIIIRFIGGLELSTESRDTVIYPPLRSGSHEKLSIFLFLFVKCTI